MIVECPSCLTKFSIDTQQLADIEDPRFNCCRCGSYFELQRSAIDESAGSGAQKAASDSFLPDEPDTEQHGTEDSNAAGDSGIENPDEETLNEGSSRSERQKPQSEYTLSENPGQHSQRPASNTSGTWLISETLSAADHSPADHSASNHSAAITSDTPLYEASEQSATTWEPDPDAELEDLFSLKTDAQQLDLLSSEQSSDDSTQADSAARATLRKTLGEPWRMDDDEDFARHPVGAQDSELDLVTAEWPDAPPKKRPFVPWAKSAESLKKTSVDESARKLRQSRLTQLLSRAKPDADEELQEAVSQDTRDRQEAIDAKALAAAERARERQARRAERRTKRQEKLMRGDITFRDSKSVGKTPGALLSKMTKAPDISSLSLADVCEQAPIACIASVPVILLLLMTVFAANLDTLPQTLQRILHVDTASLPQLPPQGLGIVDLSSSVITLDSGHRAIEIRGELLNATSRKFQTVTLLASLFNEQNQRTSSLLINPQNELQKAQVVALDRPAIERLQQRLQEEQFDVAPNARLPFRIVFPEFSSEVKWFSTSVYSAQI